MTNPEVNIEVSRAAELAVADLEGYRHLVIAVEDFVEALAAVGRELDVVGGCRAYQAGGEQQLRYREEMHGGWEQWVVAGSVPFLFSLFCALNNRFAWRACSIPDASEQDPAFG